MTKKLVLHVEDEADIRKIVRMVLTKNGYDVVEAANGEEGVEALQNISPQDLSLIIVDIRMPKINGVEFIAYTRTVYPSIPIIVFSGFPDRDLAISLFKTSRIADFLVKPVNSEALLTCVANCLSGTNQHPITEFLKKETSQRKATSATSDRPPQSEYTSIFARIAKCFNKGISQRKVTSATSDRPPQSEYRTVFAALAHDLKNEFARLSDACNSLIDQSTPHEGAKNIKVSLTYSHLIIRRMFDCLNMGTLPANPINVMKVISSAVDLIRPRLDPHIEFVYSDKLNEEGWTAFTVVADPDQLMSILVQLVRNAQNALGSKKGTIGLNVQVRWPLLAISVSDSGPGIPKAFRDILFKNPIPRNEGLGLGLYLAHRIINEWGGQIYIEKTGKNGTTISLLLPATEREATSAATRT
jgi:signal transduction histidine kinase